MKVLEYTVKGPRSVNEDSLYGSKIGNTLFACIADGVGGIKHGEIASKVAVDDFRANLLADLKISFKEQLRLTNSKLEKLAKEEYHIDMIATTFSGLYCNRKKIKGIHIGDSRVVLIRDKELIRLTEDHSEVGRLIREKKLDPSLENTYHRKNIVESVLGNETFFNFQEFEKESAVGDRIILSTDGFYESISEDVILRISNKYKSIELMYKNLVSELDNRVLKDNSSFLLLEI